MHPQESHQEMHSQTLYESENIHLYAGHSIENQSTHLLPESWDAEGSQRALPRRQSSPLRQIHLADRRLASRLSHLLAMPYPLPCMPRQCLSPLPLSVRGPVSTWRSNP